jgi:hypothetical protein
MSKMGSHCSFGHLKRKLWPKEGPRVELPGVCQFWLPTAKSRESTQNTWLQTTCDIPLKSSRRELQLCFRPHFDLRSARKVMGLQSPGTPARESRESRESRERKAIWMWVPWRVTEYTIRGKVVTSPKSGPWWVLCVRVARGWSQHQRCFNYALTTLCGLCAGPCEWISLSILPSPIPELQHAPLPLKVLWAWERILTPPSFAVFHLDSHLSPARSWECVKSCKSIQPKGTTFWTPFATSKVLKTKPNSYYIENQKKIMNKSQLGKEHEQRKCWNHRKNSCSSLLVN